MRRDKFPIDIFAVKEYGVEKWHRSFFWPVSDDEFMCLYNSIEQLLAKMATRENLETLFTIRDDLKSEYANFLHALTVIQRLRSADVHIVYSDKSQWYKNLISGGDSDLHMPRVKMRIEKAKKFNIIRVFKLLTKSLICNKGVSKFIATLKREDIVRILGSIRPIMKRYIESLPQWVLFTSAHDWLKKGNLREAPIEPEYSIRQCSHSIISGLRSIANEMGVSLSDRHIEYLLRITEEELTYTAWMLHVLDNKVKKSKKIHLLISAAGNKLSRAAGISVRHNNGSVTTFAHGGDIGIFSLSKSIPSILPVSNNFITYTKGSAQLYEKVKDTQSKYKNLDISSAESDEFFILWRKYRRMKLPHRVKRVMIIGYAHSQCFRRPFMKGGFSLSRLDLELSFIDILKKAGYYILYKAHPDRISEVKGIFENRVHVLKSDFRYNVSKADAFLFPAMVTTAFSVALCTNKPIVALDLSIRAYKPFPEPMKLLRKRCSIVTTTSDERNRIIFNEKELLNALAQKPESPNTEFIEKYMFPESVKV